jgi:GT2 family glycosyltransferase
MSFHVVIPTHRRLPLLERTLLSVAAGRIPGNLEGVIVLENGCDEGAADLCRRLASRLPLEYHHRPEAGKGRSLQWAIERLQRGFVVLLDDDVRVSDGLLEEYASAAARFGRGHFFGGPLEIDYEEDGEPEEWLRVHLPPSATGWRPPSSAPTPSSENLAFFRGANLGVFAEDLLSVSGFMTGIGPGALVPGTEGNPTGLEDELQRRLLRAGMRPVYLERAVAWHWVPRERCSERWALHRIYRNTISSVLRGQRTESRDARWLGVPPVEWERYARAVVRATLTAPLPDRRRRFYARLKLSKQRGLIHGYRIAAHRAAAAPNGAHGGGRSFPRADGLRACDGRGGETPLHAAVRARRYAEAATLLAHGADWKVPNDEGKKPLEIGFTDLDTLHRIRQEYQRLPLAADAQTAASDERVRSAVQALARDGVLRLEGYIDPERLRRLQRDFNRFVRGLRTARLFGLKRFHHYDEREHWRSEHRAYVTNDAIRHSAALLELCCDPFLLALANGHLRKPAHIKRTVAMRYLPSAPLASQQFGWHHDMEDRQLKVMILLTDVGEDDQPMTYVRGSHDTFHPYSRFLTNQLEFDYVRTYLPEIEVVKLTGRAGDAFLFDSNGMHRGNRSRGRIRDAFFVELTADRNMTNVWGSEIRRRRLEPAFLHAHHPLGPLLSVTPKWRRLEPQQRKRPSWAESLENPESWTGRVA